MADHTLNDTRHSPFKFFRCTIAFSVLRRPSFPSQSHKNRAMNRCDTPHVFLEATASFPYLLQPDASRSLSTPSPPPALSAIPSTSSSATFPPNFDMHSTSITGAPGLSSIDHISELELAFCSYFECCNHQLRDFHALVDHCEEAHLPVSRGSVPMYPLKPHSMLARAPLSSSPPTATCSTSSSRSSSVLSSPNSASPKLPATALPISVPQNLEKQSKYSVAQLSKFAYTPFNPAVSLDPIQVYPELARDSFSYGYDYDFGYEYYMQAIPSPPAPSFPPKTTRPPIEDESDSSDISTSPDTDWATSPEHVSYFHLEDDTKLVEPIPTAPPATNCGEISRDNGKGRCKIVNVKKMETLPLIPALGVTRTPKPKARLNSSGGNGHSGRREKSFHCPTVGCTKRYLNPNGLKYHLEKGTCSIEQKDDCSSAHSSPSPLVPAANTRGTPAARVSAVSQPVVGITASPQGFLIGGDPSHAGQPRCSVWTPAPRSSMYFGDGRWQATAADTAAVGERVPTGPTPSENALAHRDTSSRVRASDLSVTGHMTS